MAVSISLHLYRTENVPDGTTYGTNRVTGVFPKDVPVADIKRFSPVNATGGPDLTGLPGLYGKFVFKDSGLLQEAYVMQTVSQLHVLMNV